MSESGCVIFPVDTGNIDRIPALVRSVYNDTYYANYLYKSGELWTKIQAGNILPLAALDKDQKAVGMVSILAVPWNPRVYEIGQLMVAPEYGGRGLAKRLIKGAIASLKNADGAVSACVATDIFSQRMVNQLGFTDTALEFCKLPREMFASGKNVSCVICFLEQGGEKPLVWLPSIYREQIRFCLDGLSPREYMTAFDTVAETDTPAVYHIDSDNSSHFVLAEVTAMGSGMEKAVQEFDEYAKGRRLESMLVRISLGDPHNGAAVRLFRKQGFFFAGVLPRRFPGTDALIMQKIYGETEQEPEPDWERIALFSPKINKIAEMIKKDMHSLIITI
jgi:ribosomal protein S18 acetylase RimI-like enzyme